MAKVKFWRGAKANYNASTHANGIYFATDTQEIWLDNKCYGGVADDASVLKKAIVKAEYTKGSADAAGVVTLTAKDNTTTTITLPSVAAGNGVDVSVNEGVYTVSVKLDSTKNQLLGLGADGLYSKASLNYDSTTKEIQLIGVDGTTVDSSIDATAFIKDGMLDSVAFGKYSDDSTTDDALIFTWNTDSEKTATKIKLTDIFNPYTIGNGLNYDSATNTLSAKVASGDKYIEVTTDGIKSTDLVATMDASIVKHDSSIAALDASVLAHDASILANTTAIGTEKTDTEAATGLYKYIDDAIEDVSAAVTIMSDSSAYLKVDSADDHKIGVTVSTLESTIGMSKNADGTYSATAEGTTVTAGLASAGDVAKVIIDDELVIATALNALDTSVKALSDDLADTIAEAIDSSINALDVTDASVSGKVVVSVSEEDGLVSNEKAELQALALTGYTASTKEGAEIAATDTLGAALKKLDEDLIWNEVTA